MGSTISQQFSINSSIISLTPYITSRGKNLEKQNNIQIQGGLFTYLIPGQSVITFASN